jgi:hypothetical protein
MSTPWQACRRPWRKPLLPVAAVLSVALAVPLSPVRDLLGRASIVTTERYDNQTQDALLAAAKRLETGEILKSFSSPPEDSSATASDGPSVPAKSLSELGKEGGVGNGVRTRDFRSHSRTPTVRR